MDWGLLSYVKGSKYRITVLEQLSKSEMTPTELKTKLGCPITYVSTILKGLTKKELIINLTSGRRQKYYGLTEKGKKLLENSKKFD